MSKSFKKIIFVLFLAGLNASLAAQISTDVGSLTKNTKIVEALDYIKRIEPETIEEQIKLTEIPSPTFQEEKRGLYFKERFEQLGLKSFRVDAAGNVIGERMGSGGKDAPFLKNFCYDSVSNSTG